MNSENELTAALATIEKFRGVSGCPTGVDLQDHLRQLAAENVALKKFCKNAAFDADYEAELGMENGGFTDALNDIETPATDAYLAGIKADGVEEFANFMLRDACGDKESQREIGEVLDAVESFAQQLREVSDKC